MAGNRVIRAYQGADGPNEVLEFQVINHDGRPVAEPFAGTTHATLLIFGPNIVIDSRVAPGAINWGLGAGKIQLALGGIQLTKGAYRARLTVFDDLHPNGQVLTHEQGPNFLTIQFL